MKTNQITSVWDTIGKNVIGNDSQWLWSFAQFLTVLIGLFFIYHQIKLQRMANSLSSLTAFEDGWKATEMYAARQETCKNFGENRKGGIQSAERIACFFETLGLYHERKVFETLLIWELYSSYVEHYWPILKPRIVEMRQADCTIYTAFEALYDAMNSISRKRRAPFGEKSRAQLLEFAASELE